MGASAALPDGRGYELVSPPEKNGGDVLALAARTRAAAGEDPRHPMAAAFASLTGFGDVQGMGVATEYLSERDLEPGTRGWSTHAITPPQQPMSIAGAAGFAEPLYEGAFSDDLVHGVFRAWSPLTDAPNVADVESLYARTDLRSPGIGSYRLDSDAASSLAPNVLKPGYVGASADFSHVVFESRYALTPDAGACVPFPLSYTSCPAKLYESVDGAVRLVGILPDGGVASTGCPASLPCSTAGQGVVANAFVARQPPHVVSENGSRIVFTSPVPSSGAVSATASGTLASRLYLRDDRGTANTSDDTTVQVNASERTDCAGDPGCGGDGIPDPAPATARSALYWDAAVDDSRVLFTSLEPLTDNAPADGAAHLYLWRADAPARHHLTLLDDSTAAGDRPPGVNPTSVGFVIGASRDGRFVYFGGVQSVFAWHDEGSSPQLDFVGAVPPNSDVARLNGVAGFNWLQGSPTQSQVSPDGRRLLFLSFSLGLLDPPCDDRPVCDPDGNPCETLFVYSAETKQVASVACDRDHGPAPVTDSAYDNVDRTNIGPKAGAESTTWRVNRAISDDGRHVFFSTRQALVPQDVNGKIDAYEYDVPNGTEVKRGSVHLLSSGKDPSDSWFLVASADGRDAFFVTRERLVGWDRDDAYDLYDARVGGGVPDPAPATPECAGDGCQGALSGAPSATAPGSATFRGAGDRKPAAMRPRHKAKRCRRGLVRKRVRGKRRCVRRHRARHARRAAWKAIAR